MAKAVKHIGSVKNKTANGKGNIKNEKVALSDNSLNEPYTNYSSAIPVLNHKQANIFWGNHMHVVPAADKITIIKKGISKKELEAVKEESGLDYDTLSSILSVSKAKLNSKKGTEKFDQNTSERIMMLADVLAYGQSAFEDKNSFNEWLKTGNRALGNIAPIELMDTIYGIDEIKKEIGRIEYGVF